MVELGAAQLTLLLLIILNKVHQTKACREPENADEIKIKLYKEMRSEAKFMLVPEYYPLALERNMAKNEDRFGTTFDALLASTGLSKRTKIYGNSKCEQCDNNIGNSSYTCPWHYVLDVNINRIPVNIVMAACTCQTCRPMKSGEPCNQSTCQEIINTMPVLRKLCIEGTYKYMTHFEPVPVGCTCDRPIDI